MGEPYFKGMPVEQRLEFSSYYEPNTGCILFVAGDMLGGYGSLFYQGRKRAAHKVAWMVAGKEIPPGELLLHKCDTPCCINVDHLRLGTHRDNMRDMAVKERARPGRLGRGVSKSGVRFQARFQAPGEKRSRYIGTFPTREQAAAAAEFARRVALGAIPIQSPECPGERS